VASLALAVTPASAAGLGAAGAGGLHRSLWQGNWIACCQCKTGREIVPPPKDLELDQCIELQVTLQESTESFRVDTRKSLSRSGTAVVFSSVEQLRKDLLDQTLVYLTTKQNSVFPWLPIPGANGSRLEKSLRFRVFSNGRSRPQEQ